MRITIGVTLLLACGSFVFAIFSRQEAKPLAPKFNFRIESVKVEVSDDTGRTSTLRVQYFSDQSDIRRDLQKEIDAVARVVNRIVIHNKIRRIHLVRVFPKKHMPSVCLMRHHELISDPKTPDGWGMIFRNPPSWPELNGVVKCPGHWQGLTTATADTAPGGDL